MGGDEAPNWLTSLIAGAVAGVVVDLALFPLDTIKTRLQSEAGFSKTGGFTDVYKGIGTELIGSAPASALFFLAYNCMVNMLLPASGKSSPLNNIVAASIAELVAAVVRAPTEVIKQRRQATLPVMSAKEMVRLILKDEGWRGLYRGYANVIAREVPFGAIQFPLWEWLKNRTEARSSWEIGACGAIAGAVAAVATTPMDVIKTRVMLAELHLANKYRSTLGLARHVVTDIHGEKGYTGFFAGIVPRLLWITLGGFIYFGVYGQAVILCAV